MRDMKIRKMVLAALMAALTYVATMVVQIPSPVQGYVNLGDCCVLLSGWILGAQLGRCRRYRLYADGPAQRLCPLRPRHPGHQGLDAIVAALIVKAQAASPTPMWWAASWAS